MSITFTVPAGALSAKVRVNLFGTRAVASIATTSNLTLDGDSKLFMKVKTYFEKLDEWLYVWDSNKREDASLEILANKCIPFSPLTDLRGEEDVEFILSAVQEADVVFEIKFTSI